VTATSTVTTTYTVTGTDGNGCSSTSSVAITVGNLVVTGTPVSPAICAGDSTIINAAGATNYTWSPAVSLSGTTGSSVTAKPATTTTYTLVGSAGAGCTDTVNVIITVNPLPAISISTLDSSLCSGSGSTTLNALGGNTYTWSPSTGLASTTGASVVANPPGTTTYTVTGTSAAGCSASASITITVNPTPTISIAATGGDSLCNGQSKTLTASGAASYVWSTTATTAAINVSPTTNTTYTVYGSSGLCADSAVISVYMYPVLQVKMTGDTLCFGKTANITVNASGGKPGYTYVWNNGLGSGPGPKAVTVSGTGYYVCSVTDGCGTAVTDSAQVVAITKPNATFIATPDTIEGGQFVSFVDNNSGANYWSWTFGEGTSLASAVDSFPYFQYTVPGSYIVTLVVTNKYGCADSASDTVVVLEGIYVPNVFTPNGDGINDVFHVTAGGMKTYSIEIFNRWGERVFIANSPDIDWSGRSTAGVDESDGTYYYIIKATDYRGKDFSSNGYIQLIR
ncbi:MAG TPA: gliding motility-associated C-terminal domain-containing protein, partial [Bacteroidia bacterium]|nr:gliding motility-associated C-terminal domain-containing protein [Bacteroidia bacterium]